MVPTVFSSLQTIIGISSTSRRGIVTLATVPMIGFGIAVVATCAVGLLEAEVEQCSRGSTTPTLTVADQASERFEVDAVAVAEVQGCQATQRFVTSCTLPRRDPRAVQLLPAVL